MHTFFHGWRRKARVAVLVMALAFMVGWVRSFCVVDVVKFQSGRQIEDSLRSDSNGLSLSRLYESDAYPFAFRQPLGSLRFGSGPRFESISVTIPPALAKSLESGHESVVVVAEATVDEVTDDGIDVKWESSWEWCGFHVGGWELTDGEMSVGVTAPYWGIVVPLTLLSAYLIWFPSRKRPPASSQPHA